MTEAVDLPEDSGPAIEQGEGVAAVNRALSILAAIAEQPEPLRLAQLAAATRLYKSTILRLLVSLERFGHVQRLDDGRYGLGPAAFRLGAAYERCNPLQRQILPILRGLVDEGSESASFHVRNGSATRFCLYRVDSGHATLDRIRCGDVLPLARGAAGRVILAYGGAEDEASTRLRRCGFAFSSGERQAGCSGIAAPVFGPDQALIGALSLSGPSSRFTEASVAEWRPKLIEAAARATSLLGGSAP